MQSNKSRFGLADLKRLKRQAQQQADIAKPAQAADTRKSTSQPLRNETGRKSVSACDQPVSQQDIALFRQAVKSVKRLEAAGRQVLAPKPSASTHELRERRRSAMGKDAEMVPALSHQFAPAGLDQDDAFFLKPGVGPDVLRDLQRGKWPVTTSLDLHGATQDQAWERLSAFLTTCRAHQVRCVRIVHGKGYGSPNGAAVLKQTVRRWLAQWPDVQAYAECSARDGGSGAVQVLLTIRQPLQN